MRGGLVIPGRSRVWTASYSSVDPRVMVPVRTSIGAPRWAGYAVEEWPSVYPWGLKDMQDPHVFRRAYRHRLHQRTGRILAELGELLAAYDGWPLALLCWEDLSKPGVWCHRTLLAEWLADHTGEVVPEL